MSRRRPHHAVAHTDFDTTPYESSLSPPTDIPQYSPAPAAADAEASSSHLDDSVSRTGDVSAPPLAVSRSYDRLSPNPQSLHSIHPHPPALKPASNPPNP